MPIASIMALADTGSMVDTVEIVSERTVYYGRSDAGALTSGRLLLDGDAGQAGLLHAPAGDVFPVFVVDDAKVPEALDHLISRSAAEALDEQDAAGFERLDQAFAIRLVGKTRKRERLNDQVPTLLAEIEFVVGRLHGLDRQPGGLDRFLRDPQTLVRQVVPGDLPTLARELERVPALSHGDVERRAALEPAGDPGQEVRRLLPERRVGRVVDLVEVDAHELHRHHGDRLHEYFDAALDLGRGDILRQLLAVCLQDLLRVERPVEAFVPLQEVGGFRGKGGTIAGRAKPGRNRQQQRQ